MVEGNVKKCSINFNYFKWQPSKFRIKVKIKYRGSIEVDKWTRWGDERREEGKVEELGIGNRRTRLKYYRVLANSLLRCLKLWSESFRDGIIAWVVIVKSCWQAAGTFLTNLDLIEKKKIIEGAYNFLDWKSHQQTNNMIFVYFL